MKPSGMLGSMPDVSGGSGRISVPQSIISWPTGCWSWWTGASRNENGVSLQQMWIHYIGGLGRSDKLVVVAIGLGPDPESEMAALRDMSPFKLRLLGLEQGSRERLEEVRQQFRGCKMRGPWFKANDALQVHIEALKPVERDKAKVKRISLDLPPDEFHDVERAVGMLGLKTKARFLRRAARFYVRLGRLKAQGWAIQAVKDGQLLQFHSLDTDPDA